MTHRVFHLRDHHEGNAYAIPVTVEDTDGAIKELFAAKATYVIKETPSDDDINALVTKTGEENIDEVEIEFNSPGDGQLTVYVETGDTAGHISWESLPEDERDTHDFHHRLDIEDQDGNLVTVFAGRLTVVNS